MSRLRKPLVAVWLLAVWLLATQHCGLEAAGLFATHAEDGVVAGCCGTDRSGCEMDGCETVENGRYRSSEGGAKFVPPDATSGVLLLCSSPLHPAPESASPSRERDRWKDSRDWVPAWQFERRAAAPAHAPDSLVA